MNIAVFADVHGRILLAFQLCARWEKATGEKIDLILQAGDMGVFSEMARLDKATMRHAEREPTELGFLDYFCHPNPTAARILALTACDLVFVRGNHEDHAWLDELERNERGPIFPVDAYQRLYCLKTGVPYTFTAGAETLTILGIGRIAPPAAASQRKDSHIQPHEQSRLGSIGAGPIDVLLTHDMAPGFTRRSQGMAEIRAALDTLKPHYHFYGHVGGDCNEGIDSNGVTHYCKLADLDWEAPTQPVHPGAMALLRWHSPTAHTFTVLDDDWLREYTSYTWKHL